MKVVIVKNNLKKKKLALNYLIVTKNITYIIYYNTNNTSIDAYIQTKIKNNEI